MFKMSIKRLKKSNSIKKSIEFVIFDWFLSLIDWIQPIFDVIWMFQLNSDPIKLNSSRQCKIRQQIGSKISKPLKPTVFI